MTSHMKNKMKPTNPNAFMYVTDKSVECKVWSVECCPHRHDEARGKPGTPETRHVAAWKPAFRARLPPILKLWHLRFCSFPHRHGMTRRSQRLETRHVKASKRTFRARRSPILILGRLKIDVFLQVFKRTWKSATQKSMFRTRMYEASAKFHHMSQNATPAKELGLSTSRSPDNATRRKHATPHVWSAACHGKCNSSSDNVAKLWSLPLFIKVPWRVVKLLNATKCHACHAKIGYVTLSRLKHAKMTPPAKVTIGTADGTAILPHSGRLRTVANGCGRLRPETQRRAKTPPPRVKPEPLLRIRRKSLYTRKEHIVIYWLHTQVLFSGSIRKEHIRHNIYFLLALNIAMGQRWPKQGCEI